MKYLPQVGDMLFRPKMNGFIEHEGIVVGPDLVLDNTPEKGEHLGTITEFAAGEKVRVQRTNANQSDVMRRAQQVLSRRKNYNAAFRNCQHTVSEVLTGTAQSATVALLFLCGGLLLLIALTRRSH